MATPFQPSDSGASTMKPGIPTILLISVMCALGVVMLVAIIIPRIALGEGVDWAVTLGAGVLAFAAFFAYGWTRRQQEAGEQS